MSPKECWVELVFAAQPARELLVWRQRAGQPPAAQLAQQSSRQEPAWAVPQEQPRLVRQELALSAMTTGEPVLAPQPPGLPVLL